MLLNKEFFAMHNVNLRIGSLPKMLSLMKKFWPASKKKFLFRFLRWGYLDGLLKTAFSKQSITPSVTTTFRTESDAFSIRAITFPSSPLASSFYAFKIQSCTIGRTIEPQVWIYSWTQQLFKVEKSTCKAPIKILLHSSASKNLQVNFVKISSISVSFLR